MGSRNQVRQILAVLVAAAGFLLPAFTTPAGPKPQRRDFNIVAHKYAYDPAEIKVNQGDEVHIRFSSKDVLHGFYLEGYDLDALASPGKSGLQLRHPSQTGEFQPAEEITFTAGQRGKFRYRCSMTCGYMHPFMMGVLVVEPNTLYAQGLGLMGGLFLAALLLVWPAPKPANLRTPEGAQA